MKKSQDPRRAIFFTAAFVLLICGIILTGVALNKRQAAKTASIANEERNAATATEGNGAAAAELRREREDEAITYESQNGDEKLKLIMNRIVTRNVDGLDKIVQLNPPATAATLRKRLSEHEAPLGVYPLAYDESDSFDGLRIITSQIRAKMPREDAEKLARSKSLSIVDFPDYAPEWVIFAAADPFDAMDKIASIRGESSVQSADVLTGRRPVPMEMPNDTLIGDQWHLKASGTALPGTDMNVEDAWNYGGVGGVLGRGIRIGIVDSGINTAHPDFVGNYDNTIDKDFITGDNNPDAPAGSDEDHGTAVGGVAGARGNNDLGVSGSAPEAILVGERLIVGAFTTDKQNADALAHRVDVIEIKNNSWGYGGSLYKTDPLLEAALRNSCESGRDGKGTIFTFAAGNDGDVEDSANYSELTSSIYTMVVGATNSQHVRAFYSEPGANLVITAPSGRGGGDPPGTLGITTADRTGEDGYNGSTGTEGDYTDTFNGTSSSCPAVSGVIALVLEKNPDLGWRDVHEILIRTAVKFNPTEPGWLTNAAGLHFNNDYGAGLIDATAAVNLAATWTNLDPQISVKSTKTGLGLSIPNNSSAGRTLLFPLPSSNITTEHVTVRLTVNHSARGDLEISLTSPSGTQSKLAFVRNDLGNDYNDYTFSTVQNWGEDSNGVWTLKIADRKSTSNTTGGTVNAAEITIYGAASPPVNPAPIVQITSPQSGAIFSPGVGFTVDVSAQDFDIDGIEDEVTKVDLYENDILIDTVTTAPYSFALNPANDLYTYVAKATDPDGLEGESLPVFVTVKNQTPVIASVTLNAASQAYDDLPLSVTAVDATDPENDTITLIYKWEFSTDEENYTDSGVTTASLPVNLQNSGKLWRCTITATDGMTTSAPFVTGTVNLLDRPRSSAVRPGGTYTYQSGLVLKGDTLVINRQAIIQEFSQGPGGGTSEWIEILTLEEGSLAGWTLADNGGNSLVFAADPWSVVPAGTLIIIYNGLVDKDGLLPADNTDFSDGSVVISSTNETHFTAASAWPTLDNLGDSIFLRDGIGASVHELAYGNSLFASPNVGRVGASQAAYFAGQSDAGASLANEWLVTSGSSARTAAFTAALSPPSTNSIFPAAVFTNGRYVQDFGNVPGASGTLFPTGWSSYSVDLGTTQTTNYDEMLLLSDGTRVGSAFNFGSRIGMLAGSISGGTTRFDPGFIALALDNTRGLTGLQISYDIIKIAEQQKSMTMNLEYTTGNPGNTSTTWNPVSGAAYNSDTSPTGTVIRLNNVPLPTIFEDRESPIYLRWYYHTAINNQKSGQPDALAIDGLIISSDSSPNIFLTLGLDPDTFSEADGENASVGSVTISQAVSYDLSVNISSSDITEAAVPAFVVIPAGELSTTFPIRAVDDIISDGVQSSTITLSATDFLNVSKVLTITDDEPILIGVTPGLPNNPGNGNFVDRLRIGKIYEAPAYFVAAETPLPDGLFIDSETGLISGTVSPTATLGEYTVIIEIRNVLGGFSSQTIVIEVSDTVFSSYSQWIDQFANIDKSVTGNTDLDDLPNLVEYVLNSRPDHFEQPSPVTSSYTPAAMSITYTRSKDVNDVSLVAEWSPTMAEGSWETEGVLNELLVDGIDTQTIRSSVTIDPLHPARFMRLKAVGPPPPE